jgi:beta-galactosidase
MNGLNYKAVDTCSVIHAEGARVLATYTDQYFAGAPALTVNSFGKGNAYYIAARTTGNFLRDFYRTLRASLGLERALHADLPAGVTAQLRTDGQTRHLFLLNFNRGPARVSLDAGYTDRLTGQPVSGEVTLERYAVRVLSRPRCRESP